MSEQKTINPGENIIFYDGVCGLCNKLVQFVLKHDAGSKFLFCSLQSEVAVDLLTKYGASNKDLNTIFVITDYNLPASKLLSKSRAVFFILQCCDILPNKAWMRLTSVLPQFILNLGYDFIAYTRYKLFGRSDSCIIPPKKVRDRFIDQ